MLLAGTVGVEVLDNMTMLAEIEQLNLKTRASERELDGDFADFANAESHDRVSLSGHELQVLALWDQLQELRLERELLETQMKLQSAGERLCSRLCRYR